MSRSENQEKVNAFLQSSVRRAQEGPWAYLASRVSGIDGLVIGIAAETQHRFGTRSDIHVASGLLESRLTASEFLDELAAAAERAPLSQAKKRQLTAGLGHLRDHDYELAVPMLINPLEGAFWRLAEQRDLIVRDDRGNWSATEKTGKPGKPIGGVEAVVRLPGFSPDARFEDFVILLTYGGGGNPFRHGTADDGWQIRALCLEVCLAGLLDLFGVFDSKTHIRNAFNRHRRLNEESDEDTAQLGAECA